jgi:hypothetical protein
MLQLHRWLVTRLAEVAGVDPNFQRLGEGVKWRYVLMRTLNSTQV